MYLEVQWLKSVASINGLIRFHVIAWYGGTHCKPSYCGERTIVSSKPEWAKLARFYLRNKNTRAKGLRA
jgi:hypothetical protein